MKGWKILSSLASWLIWRPSPGITFTWDRIIFHILPTVESSVCLVFNDGALNFRLDYPLIPKRWLIVKVLQVALLAYFCLLNLPDDKAHLMSLPGVTYKHTRMHCKAIIPSTVFSKWFHGKLIKLRLWHPTVVIVLAALEGGGERLPTRAGGLSEIIGFASCIHATRRGLAGAYIVNL